MTKKDEPMPIPDADLPVEERDAFTPATDTVKVPAQGDPEPADPGENSLDEPNTVEDVAGTPAPEEAED